MGIGDTAASVGKGLFAGAAGTVAMTVSSTLEAKLRERGSSSAPADAAGKALGVQPRDEEGQARFSNIVHWAYGTSWGAVRGLLHAAGVDGGKAPRCTLPLSGAAPRRCSLPWTWRPRPGSRRQMRSPSTRSTTPSTPWPPVWRSRPWSAAPRNRLRHAVGGRIDTGQQRSRREPGARITCRRSGGERQPAYASYTGGLPADEMPAARCGGWAMSRR